MDTGKERELRDKLLKVRQQIEIEMTFGSADGLQRLQNEAAKLEGELITIRKEK